MAQRVERKTSAAAATERKNSVLAVVYRPLSELVPYARNARTHSDEQVAQIAASIKEFGFTNPVLLDGSDGIIAGHGRVLAAQLLGLEEAPCIRLPHLTEAQKKAYVIALCGVRSYVAFVDQPSCLQRISFRNAT